MLADACKQCCLAGAPWMGQYSKHAIVPNAHCLHAAVCSMLLTIPKHAACWEPLAVPWCLVVPQSAHDACWHCSEPHASASTSGRPSLGVTLGTRTFPSPDAVKRYLNTEVLPSLQPDETVTGEGQVSWPGVDAGSSARAASWGCPVWTRVDAVKRLYCYPLKALASQRMPITQQRFMEKP